MAALGAAVRFLRRHPRFFTHLLLRKARLAARYRWIRRAGNGNSRPPAPLIYKLMLNWKCNLRCPMCMLWGEKGWVKGDGEASRDELDWSIIEQVFDDGLSFNTSLILSGGEPFLYGRIHDLLNQLKKRRTFAIICTNGTLLDRFVDDFDDNPYATLLISLDGLEDVNRDLRGDGVFGKVLSNIELLQRLSRPPYIAVQFSIMPENVGQMEQFCEEMVARDVDWILLNPGWFISEGQARAYEQLMEERFGIRPTTHLGYLRNYDYDTTEFRRQLERIWSRDWPIRIGSHLGSPGWVDEFIGSPASLIDNRLCYKQWLRLDIMPDGKVAPCAQFPDLKVGDLHQQTLDEVWNGEANRRFQRMIYSEPLPVCAKCDCIYLYDGRA